MIYVIICYLLLLPYDGHFLNPVLAKAIVGVCYKRWRESLDLVREAEQVEAGGGPNPVPEATVNSKCHLVMYKVGRMIRTHIRLELLLVS